MCQYALTDIVRFWRKVDRSSGPHGCWPWMASKNQEGYGRFYLKGSLISSHRVAFSLYLLKSGIFPGSFICHTCDNPSCCNPEHLYEGDVHTNAYDRKTRGNQIRGSDYPASKLSAGKVRMIRLLLEKGNSGPVLARKFGVTRQAINDIRHRKTWHYLKDLDREGIPVRMDARFVIA